MKITGKWIALSLTAALLASNLTMPVTSLTAFGADTVTAEESTSTESAEAMNTAQEKDSQSEDAEAADQTQDVEEASAEESGAAEDSVSDSENEIGDEVCEEEEDAVDAGALEEAQSGDETSEDAEDEEAAAQEAAAENNNEDDEAADEETAGESSAEEGSADEEAAEGASEDAEEANLTAPGQTSETSQEAADAAQEAPEEHPDLFAEGRTESFIPIDEVCEDTDNDDVFAAYVNRELELTDDLKYDTGDLEDTSNNSEKAYASKDLTGYNRTIYGMLYKEIGKVAAGERTDTNFTFTLEDLGLNDKYWSASDLGVSDIVVTDSEGNSTISEDAVIALDELINISFSDVVRSLLLDCPYDLYWYDKTASSDYSFFGYSAAWDGEQYLLYYDGDNAAFSFPVSADYSANGATETYKTNAEIGTAVSTAYKKAHSIVDDYSDCSDYEKLDGYREMICSLASYNDDAATNIDTNYGDPWQLIWVFDGNDSTEVVCEGYSKGFQYLCDLSEWNSIFSECISVVGYMNGGGHMWNIVSLRDGRSYLVDITNCDDGMIGSGNNNHDLFLVGTGSEYSEEIYCQGNIDDGYVFANLGNLTYTYKDTSTYRLRDYFDDAILTLAEGRVDATTTADGEYTGNHTHVYIDVDEVASTCLEKGHSAGKQCAICDEYDESVEIYPLSDHTPGDWTVTTQPTYDKEGVESTKCTVCGETMTRSVDKLVSESSVSLDTEEAALDKGSTKQLTATVLPEDAYDRSVTWTSSDTSVATVSDTGLVTAKGNGTAVITAKTAHLGLTATCKITVTTPVEGVTLDQTEASICIGNTLKLNASVTPEDASNKEITWKSSAPEIASVTDGTVEAVATGTATITVETAEGGFTDTCKITVTKLSITDEDVSDIDAVTYNGQAQEPAVTVKVDNTLLVKNTDYTVSYKNNTNAGTASVTITGKGIYAGTVTKNFTINQASIDEATVEGIPEQTYTGNALEPSVTVFLGDTELVKDTDYTVSYENNTNAGTATAVIAGKGNFSGETTVDFIIEAASIETAVVSDIPVQEYTGSALKPAVTVTLDGTELVSGTDYIVEYKNNIEAGTATATISGKGNYNGTIEKTFTITKITVISEEDISGIENKTYTGQAQTQTLIVKADDTVLTEGTDYTVSYDNNINAGTATVTITGKGNCTGTVTKTFTIAQASITEDSVDDIASVTYTGSEQKPGVTVTFNDAELSENTDFTVAFTNNINAGTATATITGTGNFTGTVEKNFTIEKAAITKESVDDIASVTYNGSEQEPDVTVTINNAVLSLGTDFTVAYKNNTNAGTATADITGTGNYTGTVSKSFTINPSSISGASAADIADQTYTGSAVEPDVKVTLGGTDLVKDTDYTVTYENNTNAGTATANITGTGNYTGSISKTFTINPASISDAVVDAIADQPYTGSAVEPDVKVTLGGTDLVIDTDYTVTYENNTNAGTATANITGTGNYTGTIEKTFNIIEIITIAEDDVSGIEDKTYSGGAQTQTLTVTVRDTVLTEGTDYTVSYQNNVNAGTATVTITGIKPYEGTVSKTFTIAPASISGAAVSNIANKTYNGASQTQTPVVKMGSTTLAAGTDYTVAYSNNKNAGTATVTITGKGNYTGSVSKTFTIAKAAQSFRVSASASTIEVGQTAKVTCSGAKETSKYTFSSTNNAVATVAANGTVTAKAPGTVRIWINTAATTNYTAARWYADFTVKKTLQAPLKCRFTKWNNKKYTGCRIDWNAVSGAQGYQAEICWTSGSKLRTFDVTTTYCNFKVENNHVSRVRVRAYHTINGKREYGPWSNQAFITPSPSKLTTKILSKTAGKIRVKVTWNIIYGSSGYNVFMTTNPNKLWRWNKSTNQKATSTKAVITACGGKLKKNVRYYVRIVTRRKAGGVFHTVPMPAKNTYVGSFIIK